MESVARIEAPPAIWKVRAAEPDAVARLVAGAHVDPIVAQLLVNRGVTDPARVDAFLFPSLDDLFDPYLLPDVDKAVERLARAIETGEKILIHGDYDADGVTSTALCLRALTGLGANVTAYLPRRSDGYNLRRRGVDRAKEVSASLILTCDCGVAAVDAVEYANSLGIDVVITDHHRPEAKLPPAVAIVDPYRDGFDPPFRDLCGAGVAFKVLDALTAKIAPKYRDAFRMNFVDLAALGTVADVTTLSGENRILVAHGLRSLAHSKKIGVLALLKSVQLENCDVLAENISFKLAPRINAAGRHNDPSIAYELLTTKDEALAESLALEMARMHAEVQQRTALATDEALHEALAQGDRNVLVLARESWPKGVVGIVAIRVMEIFGRPVICLGHDPASDCYGGSGRAPAGFNLLAALEGCADLLESFGGHHASAGVGVHAKNLDAFRDRIDEMAARQGLIEPLPPVIEIDARIDDASLWTVSLIEQMGQLGPFGRDNPDPTFVTRGRVLKADRIGKDLNTVRFDLILPGRDRAFKGIRFKSGDWAEKFPAGTDIDVVYTLKLNHWNGNTNVESQIIDMREA